MFLPKNIKHKTNVLATSIAAALSVGHVGQSTAQEGSTELEEITVTGSRIVRRDFQANSPIQTIDAETFEQISALGVENALNRLPQFTPAATQYTQIADGELINTGATITAGASTLSLRGLGPNRNLVLIDGRRAMPVNATMAVDMNSIPSAAIQRVETITGGASSVYGADAVAGVVNFILKRDFEGVELDMQYGAMPGGHGGEGRFSALFGANTADGRGNAMLGVEYFDRNSVDRTHVDFYLDGLRDPTVNGTQSFTSDPYYQIDGTNPPSGAAVDSIFDEVAPGIVLRNSSGSISGGRVVFNDDLSLYTGNAVFGGTSPAGPGGVAGNYRYNGPFELQGTPFRKFDPDGRLEENILGHKATVPLERFSLFGRAQYELNDYMTAFAQVSAVESNLRQLWQWSPAAGGWSSMIPHGEEVYEPSLAEDGISTLPEFQAGGPIGVNCGPTGGCSKNEAFPVSPELAILLDSRPNPEAPWNLSFFFDYPLWGMGDPRLIDTATKTNQYSFGLEGRVDAIDGSWDIVASHGTSTTILNLKGYAGLERHRTLMQSPNYGKGFFRGGNPQGGGFSGGLAQCTSGLPVFRDHSEVTQDCLDVFMVDLQNNAEMKQDYIQANLQGRIMDLPAGEARFATGAEWRRNNYFYVFDTLTTQNSFLDLSMGTFPADNVEGRTAVKEVYGELFVPLLTGLTGVEHLNAELGYRYSDYDLQGGIDTYKALADWGITEELRFRGGYQLATRAPNIAELFQAQAQSWSGGIGDPCGLNSVSANSANPDVNPNAAQIRAMCEEFMGQVGAASFYDPDQPQPNGFGALWFVNAVGNPNVGPEEATTQTAGFVWQPVSSNPLIAGLSGSVDWFSIEIDDMIALESGPQVYLQCFDPNVNPNFSADHPSCMGIERNPTSGGVSPTNVTYQNTGFAKIEGVDLALNWQAALADMGIDAIPGFFGVNFMLSTLLTLETQASDDEPVVDWKGSMGPDPGTSLNNGAYDYRTFTTFNYGFDNWNFNLRWRHLPEAESALRPIAGDNPIPNVGADESYDVFDFSASWNLSDTYEVRLGIDNLFDTDPVITGAETDVGGNIPTTGAGTTEAGFYDILGRRWFLGVKANF